MNLIRNMSAMEFVDHVKKKYNLFTLKEVSEHYGLSKSRVSQWLNKNTIPPKYLKMEMTKANPPINRQPVNKKGESMLDIDNRLIDSQQTTIGLLKEKVDKLELELHSPNLYIEHPEAFEEMAKLLENITKQWD